MEATATQREGFEAVQGAHSRMAAQIIGLFEGFTINGLTRQEIATRMGKPASSITAPVKNLIDAGKLVERGTRKNPQSGVSNNVLMLAGGV